MGQFYMSDWEIIDTYRKAKHPKEQIKILADMNLVDPKVIKNFLESKGELVVTKNEARHIWTRELEDKLLEMRKAGTPYLEIAKAFGVTESSITNKLQKMRKAGIDISVAPAQKDINQDVDVVNEKVDAPADIIRKYEQKPVELISAEPAKKVCIEKEIEVPNGVELTIFIAPDGAIKLTIKK